MGREVNKGGDFFTDNMEEGLIREVITCTGRRKNVR